MSDTKDKDVPGSSWRVLAHRGSEAIELENQGVLDEVVIDQWFHLEQMDTRRWWMRLGDARISINIDEDGKAHVDIERGSYEEVEGETKNA